MHKDENNHDHCENCGNHDHDHEHHHHDHEEEMDIIHLTLDDDSTLDCGVLGIFEVEDKEYIALVPLEEEEGQENDALLYEYKDQEDGEFELSLIEDEDEFNSVVDAFYALFSDGEINFEEDEDK